MDSISIPLNSEKFAKQIIAYIEIVILLGIPLKNLFIAWFKNEYDMTVRKSKKFGERENKSVTLLKKTHKLEKVEENDKKY